METLKVTFQTPLTLPSIHWSPSFHRESSPQPVPGTVLSHEDEDTAASKIPLSPTKKKNKTKNTLPHGAGLQVGDTFLTLLPSQDLSVRQEARALLLLCSHVKGRGLPQNDTWNIAQTAWKLLSQKLRERLLAGKVLTPISRQLDHSYGAGRTPICEPKSDVLGLDLESPRIPGGSCSGQTPASSRRGPGSSLCSE